MHPWGQATIGVEVDVHNTTLVLCWSAVNPVFGPAVDFSVFAGSERDSGSEGLEGMRLSRAGGRWWGKANSGRGKKVGRKPPGVPARFFASDGFSAEDGREGRLLLIREEVPVALPHFFRLVAHPGVDEPLIDTAGGTVRGER